MDIYVIMDIFGPKKGRKYPRICGCLANCIGMHRTLIVFYVNTLYEGANQNPSNFKRKLKPDHQQFLQILRRMPQTYVS